MGKIKRGPIFKKIFIIILAFIIILVCVGPIFFILWNIGKSPNEYIQSKFAPPTSLESLITNLNILKKSGIIRQLVNTLVVVIFSVFLTTFFCSMSGFAFSKLKIVGGKIIYWLVISLLAMPTQVFIIPLFVMFNKIKLTNSLLGLILIYTAFHYAFGTFLMKSFYEGIPDAIIDSAKIDGASNIQIFFRIMIPLGKPAIITLGVIDFFICWNDFFVPLVFNQDAKSKLITPGIALFQQLEQSAGEISNFPLIFTGVIISSIIPLIVYFIFQNRIAAGLTVGALKE